jgi:hypothetical protein
MVKAFLAALIAGLITFVTAMVAVFSNMDPGSNLTQVPLVPIIVGAFGGLLTFLKDIQSQLNEPGELRVRGIGKNMPSVFMLFIFGSLIALQLGGCVSSGLVKQEDERDKVLVAVGEAQALAWIRADDISKLLKSGKITQSEAQVKIQQVTSANQQLEQARYFALNGDLSNAKSRLTAAKSVLQQLKAFIEGLRAETVPTPLQLKRAA